MSVFLSLYLSLLHLMETDNSLAQPSQTSYPQDCLQPASLRPWQARCRSPASGSGPRCPNEIPTRRPSQKPCFFFFVFLVLLFIFFSAVLARSSIVDALQKQVLRHLHSVFFFPLFFAVLALSSVLDALPGAERGIKRKPNHLACRHVSMLRPQADDTQFLGHVCIRTNVPKRPHLKRA